MRAATTQAPTRAQERKVIFASSLGTVFEWYDSIYLYSTLALPLLATAMVAASGDIYYGLWYPIVVALMTLVIGGLFLKDTRGVKISGHG